MLDIRFSISTSCLIVPCVLDLVWVPVPLVLRLWIRGQQNNNLIAWVLASRCACAVAQGDLVESDTLLHVVSNTLVLYTGTLTPKFPPPLLKLREPLRILEPELNLFLAYATVSAYRFPTKPPILCDYVCFLSDYKASSIRNTQALYAVLTDKFSFALFWVFIRNKPTPLNCTRNHQDECSYKFLLRLPT